MSLPVQVISHIILTNIGPIVLSLVSYMYSATPVQPHCIQQELHQEKELDVMHMDRLIKWMNMLFDDNITSTEIQKAYKSELYSIYVGIVSDYKQYQQWRKYNGSLWLFTTYRKKNTQSLATKIMTDCTLFKEGLQLFSMMH